MAKDPYRYFRIEAREILEVLSLGVLHAKEPAGGGSGAEVEHLLRACHTLKGAAGVVGHEAIGRLAHQLEGLVAAHVRESGELVSVSMLLEIVDAIARELDALGTQEQQAEVPATIAAHGPRVEGDSIESVRLDLLEVDSVLTALADLTGRLASARSDAQSGLDELETRILQLEKQGHSKTELIVETVERLRYDVRVAREQQLEALEGAERRAREALEAVRRLRLLPAETLLTELGRAARHAAAREGRSVELGAAGGEIRLDARVLRLLRDALLQLVRNAIAHALEPEPERRRLGKPDVGQITVGFALRGARAVVTCRDDGRGIDLEAIRAGLVGRGLLAEHEAASMGIDALIRTAMRGGVSTRASATELAGRGLGLQVVGAVIDRLRGGITVRSEPGRGTEFELDVPVSMTGAPALVVEAGEVAATIPLDIVRTTIRVSANQLICAPDGDSFSHDGDAVCFASLARVLGLPAAPAPRDVWTAVLLDSSRGRVAIGVDRVIGIVGEVVLPLPAPTKADPLVVGASLDGRGDPRIALDPRLLVERGLTLPGTSRSAVPPKRPILVIDDSLTSRMLERSILEAAGYDVTTAASAEEAIGLVHERAFSMFVVDVEMPGMGGLELVAWMRRDPALAGIPAVLVTSRASPEDRRLGLEAGARAYIVKGEFAQDEFLEVVRRLVG